jgi:hypothetical protein
LTTPTSKHDTSTARSWQSDAPAQNQQSGHTAEENAQPAKGNAMDPLDEIIKRIDAINKQVDSIMELLRIEHIVEENDSDA